MRSIVENSDLLSFTVAEKTHREIYWNPALREWFCVRCGRTSDHVSQADARAELEQHDCALPVAQYGSALPY
jgi:hypothetical protein